MNLDTISTGFNRRARRIAEIGDGLSHLFGCQRARCGDVLHPCHGKHTRTRRDCGGCHALAMVRSVVGVVHAPGMHELDEDFSALVVDGRCDLPPAGDMFGCIDARCHQVALAVIGGLGAFSHDQAEAGALFIIFGG